MQTKLMVGACFLIGIATGTGDVRADGLKNEESVALSPKQMAALRALTVDGVAAAATIVDDDLETVATITTEKAWRNKGSFTDRVRSDNFLRALIDKRTGVARYQVYETVTYSGPFRNLTSANYATPRGPVSARVIPIEHEILGCTGGLCLNRDDVAFDIDEVVLRTIAEQDDTGSGLWLLRFKGQGGLDWNDQLAKTEVAGLLKAVLVYRQRSHGEVR
jgi:hypothetical protein